MDNLFIDNGQWNFWDETGAYVGPFETREIAVEACNEYCLVVLEGGLGRFPCNSFVIESTTGRVGQIVNKPTGPSFLSLASVLFNGQVEDCLLINLRPTTPLELLARCDNIDDDTSRSVQSI